MMKAYIHINRRGSCFNSNTASLKAENNKHPHLIPGKSLASKKLVYISYTKEFVANMYLTTTRSTNLVALISDWKVAHSGTLQTTMKNYKYLALSNHVFSTFQSERNVGNLTISYFELQHMCRGDHDIC